MGCAEGRWPRPKTLVHASFRRSEGFVPDDFCLLSASSRWTGYPSVLPREMLRARSLCGVAEISARGLTTRKHGKRSTPAVNRKRDDVERVVLTARSGSRIAALPSATTAPLARVTPGESARPYPRRLLRLSSRLPQGSSRGDRRTTARADLRYLTDTAPAGTHPLRPPYLMENRRTRPSCHDDAVGPDWDTASLGRSKPPHAAGLAFAAATPTRVSTRRGRVVAITTRRRID